MKLSIKKLFGIGQKQSENQYENQNDIKKKGNGNRKLVLDPKTGKYQWTEGVSKFAKTTVEELKGESAGPELTDFTAPQNLLEVVNCNMFKVNIKDIDSKFIKSYQWHGPVSKTKKVGTKETSSVEVYVSPTNMKNILSLKKGARLGDVTIDVLDRAEKKLFAMTLKSAVVQFVHVPMYLNYKNDDVLTVHIEFNHNEVKYTF